jgi:hypothetical protein
MPERLVAGVEEGDEAVGDLGRQDRARTDLAPEPETPVTRTSGLAPGGLDRLRELLDREANCGLGRLGVAE